MPEILRKLRLRIDLLLGYVEHKHMSRECVQSNLKSARYIERRKNASRPVGVGVGDVSACWERGEALTDCPVGPP